MTEVENDARVQALKEKMVENVARVQLLNVAHGTRDGDWGWWTEDGYAEAEDNASKQTMVADELKAKMVTNNARVQALSVPPP